MYLASKRIKGKTYFFIKESVKTKNGYDSRHLFDLGTEPESFIVYPGGNSFYIDDAVEDALKQKGVDIKANQFQSQLEDIFWPFLDPALHRTLTHFKRRDGRSYRHCEEIEKSTSITGDGVHLFDKRRLHYLRFGKMNQGRIGLMPDVLFKWMEGKSRDEIEFDFTRMEYRLKDHELKNYSYVIFDIQRFFMESIAKNAPENLNQEKVDEYFMSEICRINDELFFQSALAKDENTFRPLHDHLFRYIIMFFDNDYLRTSLFDEIAMDFMNRHRRFRFPEGKMPMSFDNASKIFGVNKDDLKGMSSRELTQLYRKTAQKTHPDVGGDHNRFIELTEAYKDMLKRLR